MKKKIEFPLRSFGAEGKDPEKGELIDWIKEQRKGECDLISYKLERSLKEEEMVDIPSVGGYYYGERLHESIEGIEESFLTKEPGSIPSLVIQDALRIAHLRKRVWCTIPAPSMLGVEDHYFHDREEYYGSLCDVYQTLMREMRDAGIQGHILLGDRFHEIEREELSGARRLLFCPEWDTRVLTGILEVQDIIAVPAENLPHAIALAGEYDVKTLVLMDASPEDFALALEHFDRDQLMAGGYCRDRCAAYWKGRKEDAGCLEPG
jgi:hypothetical protein